MRAFTNTEFLRICCHDFHLLGLVPFLRDLTYESVLRNRWRENILARLHRAVTVAGRPNQGLVAWSLRSNESPVHRACGAATGRRPRAASIASTADRLWRRRPTREYRGAT